MVCYLVCSVVCGSHSTKPSMQFPGNGSLSEDYVIQLACSWYGFSYHHVIHAVCWLPDFVMSEA